ncbi:hypothetical protein ACJVC5_07070 [Peredibacter sp. HCB2-198]|uniref:hypothetical protein n=1 Tax=Peredibacter sp. HCB2-198 TaxID=3383025 RepID=UPI0038B5DD10
MKKLLILITVFVLHATQAFAQEMTCLDKLMPYNRHSGLHQLTKDEWNDGKETMDAESAKIALLTLVNAKLLCKPNEVAIKVFPVCSSIVADLTQSTTCFAYTNLGYFVISRDNGRNVNFIFSKDKRFSEPADENL